MRNTLDKEIKEQKENCLVQDYVEAYRPVLWGLAVLVFIAHGSVLFSERFGVDTELAIDGIHNFDKIGRQGLVWLGKLLGMGWFNLYYAQALTLLFLLLSPMAFGYLFYRLGGTAQRTALFAFGASYICSVFWTAQIYFLNQSAQITCCGILVPAAILALHRGFQGGRVQKAAALLAAWLLQQIIFSCYQVLIVFYVTAVAAAFLVYAGGKRSDKKQMWKWTGVQAGSFFVGVLSYLLLARLFYMQGGSYLGGQLKWGTKPAGEVLADCFLAVGDALRINYPYYTGLYGVFAGIFLIVGIRYVVRKHYQGSPFLFFGAAAIVILSPFVFCFFYGGEMLDRMQLVMPLAQGCMLYLIVKMVFEMAAEKTDNEKGRLWLKRAGLTLLLVLVFRETTVQLSFCNRLYYTDAQRFAFDYQMSHDLYEALERYKAAHELPEEVLRRIVFVGYPKPHYNKGSVAGHTIGYSNLAFDRVDQSFERKRMLTFMRDAGYPLVPEPWFTEEEKQIYDVCFEEYFGEAAAKMPCFPAQDSIQLLEAEEADISCIVVKFSEE
ncbi:MAG: glucosyltransferase domain-containing protein [Roseburia sp.]|nr:glucosyltransferase domain-containing protein [Roseburia sp.]